MLRIFHLLNIQIHGIKGVSVQCTLLGDEFPFGSFLLYFSRTSRKQREIKVDRCR